MAFSDDLQAQQETIAFIENQANSFLNDLLNTTNVSFGDNFNIDNALPNRLGFDAIQEVNFVSQNVGFTPDITVVSAVAPTAPTLSFSAISDVTVPDLDVAAPALAYPSVPSTTLPDAPGAAPAFVSPAIPDAPLVSLPAVPTLASLALPEVPTVDLTTLDISVPADDLAAPTAQFEYYEAAYDSVLLDPLKAKLLNDLVNGGYGIEPADELAMFNRFRDRAVETMMGSIDDAGRVAAARGFPLPPGELSVHVDRAYQAMQNKVADASREILLERNKLFVENRQFTIREVKDLEQVLINFHNAVQERALKVAQLTVEMSIAVFRALVERYNARLMAYKAQSEVFVARIQAELAKAQIYKTQVDAVGVSAQVQRTQVETYLAQLKGIQVSVDIYKTQMDAARVQADIGRMALEAFQAQVGAYTAQVQAKNAEFGMYRAQIDGEIAKVQAYEAQVRAFGEQMKGAKLRADVQLGRLQSETEQARARIAAYQGQLDQYKADVQTQIERGKLEVSYHSDLVAQARMLNDGAIAKAGLQQEAYRAGIEWNTKVVDSDINRARAKLEAAVAALKFRTEGTHYASEKFFAILTALMGTINTLSVSTTTQ